MFSQTKSLKKEEVYRKGHLDSSMMTTVLCLSIDIRNGKIVWKHGPYLAEF